MFTTRTADRLDLALQKEVSTAKKLDNIHIKKFSVNDDTLKSSSESESEEKLEYDEEPMEESDDNSENEERKEPKSDSSSYSNP